MFGLTKAGIKSTLTKCCKATAAKKVLDFALNNRAEIATGVGLIAVGTALVLAIKEGPRVKEALEDKKMELGVNEEAGEKLSIVETGKVVAVEAAPALISYGVGAGCIIYGAVANRKKIGALGASAALAQYTLAEYMSNTEKEVGKEKADEINKKTAKTVIQHQYGESDLDSVPGTRQLIYSPYHHEFRKCNLGAFKAKVLEYNQGLLNGEHYDWNEFWSEFGFNDQELMDGFVWEGMDNDRIEFNYDPMISSDNTVYVEIALDSYPAKWKKENHRLF